MAGFYHVPRISKLGSATHVLGEKARTGTYIVRSVVPVSVRIRLPPTTLESVIPAAQSIPSLKRKECPLGDSRHQG
jgi:hypothetical protein